MQNVKHVNSQQRIDSFVTRAFILLSMLYVMARLKVKDVRTLAATMQNKLFIMLPTFQASSGYQKRTNKSTDKFREEADTSVFHNQQSPNSCVSGTEG